MKTSKLGVGTGLGAALALLGSATPAWGAGAPALPWMSPTEVTSSVPVHVASIAPCPPPPNPGDTVLVQVNLSFGPGGSGGEILAANPDGSWSGDVTFYFSGVNLRVTTINAECVDPANGGTSYAQYRTRHTRLSD